MRTIKNLQVPKEQDLVKFPNSTILNETDTNDGTPVVREIYGDILTNLYAFCVDRGIIPNEIEDNEVNGYQILDALRLNVNKLNDVRRVLEKVSENVYRIDIDFNIISDRYPIFVKSPENILLIEYFNKIIYLEDSKGVRKIINFNKQVFSGDELLFIISDEVTAVNLIHNDLYEDKVELNIQGVPLSYSTSNLNDYLDNNTLIYNNSSSIDLSQFLDPNIIIRDMVLLNDFYFIFCIDSSNDKLHLYKYKRGDNNVEEILIQGINDNNQTPGLRTSSVQMYVFKNNIAFSHKGGNVFNVYIISMFNYDGSNLLKYVSDVTLDNSFNGSSSYFMENDSIIMADTLSQDLYKYNFSGGKESIYKIKQNIVNLYTKNTNDRYIQVDETAVKWK